MEPAPRKQFVPALLILAVLIALSGWLIAREMRQQQWNRELIAAIHRRDTPTALALLAQGADPNARDYLKPTGPFWQRLLARLGFGRSPSTFAPTALQVALEPLDPPVTYHLAMPPEKQALIEALVARGASLSVRDITGDTPLILAAASAKPDLVRFLLEHGADPNAREMHGYTPMMLLAYRDDPASVPILVAKGAYVNAQDDQGCTALMTAIQQGHMDVARALLDAHADPSIKDKNGQTVLYYAGIRRATAFLDLLKRYGAKGNRQ